MAYVKASVRSAQLVEAARRVLARDGVQGTTMRGVAAEAGVPLGTLSYVFGSKEQLLKAVIEDVSKEIAEVLRESAETDKGLEHAIRAGTETFWETPGGGRAMAPGDAVRAGHVRARGRRVSSIWRGGSTERYCRIVAAWCQEAANNAGELCAVPFDAWPG